MKKIIMLLVALSILMLTGCKESEVPVSVHGVNYSGQIFSYVLVDPANKNNAAGGETIDPYGAGGTMCCYTLPAKWTPGMKVQINAIHWLPRKADGSLPEIKETQVVEVPRYVDGKPGELWVLRGADGKVSLISSDYQPDHEKWPGKIKGWPVPSKEYQKKIYDEKLSAAIEDVKMSEEIIKEYDSSMDDIAKKSWDLKEKYRPNDLLGFSDSSDPMYRKKLKSDSEENLSRKRNKLERLREAKP